MGNSKCCKCSPCCDDPQESEQKESLINKQKNKGSQEQKEIAQNHYLEQENQASFTQIQDLNEKNRNSAYKLQESRLSDNQQLQSKDVQSQLNEKEQVIQRKKEKIQKLKSMQENIQNSFLIASEQKYSIYRENQLLRQQLKSLYEQVLKMSVQQPNEDQQDQQDQEDQEEDQNIQKISKITLEEQENDNTGKPFDFEKEEENQSKQKSPVEEIIKIKTIIEDNQFLKQDLEEEEKLKSFIQENSSQAKGTEEEVVKLRSIIEEYRQKAEEYDELIESKVKDMERIKQQSWVIKQLTEEIKQEEEFEFRPSVQNLIKEREQQKRMSLQNNILLQQIKEYETEKEMPILNIFKLFEEIMDRKAIEDQEDIQVKVIPRPMTQFMLDYMIQKYGLKSLACQNIAALVKGLQRLHSEGQEYAILFCRLLQIFDPNPMDKPLIIFIV